MSADRPAMRGKPYRLFALVVGLAALALAAADRLPAAGDASADPLQAIPEGQWVRIAGEGDGWAPRFRGHGAAVWQAAGESILMFGSDTHGMEHDNGVYAFDLATLSWEVLAPPTPHYAQRVDGDGVRRGGIVADAPWAMHIYNNMVWDPTLEGLVVTSSPLHNHRLTASVREDPVWLFRPDSRSWQRLPVGAVGRSQAESRPPQFFGGATAYDPVHDAILGYNALAEPVDYLPVGDEYAAPRFGIWMLGPDRGTWTLIDRASRHNIGVAGAFDSRRADWHLIGRPPQGNGMTVFESGPERAPGHWWREVSPDRQTCRVFANQPTVYASHLDAVVRLVDDGAQAETCVLDAADRRESVARFGDLPATEANHHLVYAPERRLLLLVTGNAWRNERATVWALRTGGEE
jgi:hypothetical protein